VSLVFRAHRPPKLALTAAALANVLAEEGHLAVISASHVINGHLRFARHLAVISASHVINGHLRFARHLVVRNDYLMTINDYLMTT
jgi:hypothetical protein